MHFCVWDTAFNLIFLSVLGVLFMTQLFLWRVNLEIFPVTRLPRQRKDGLGFQDFKLFN